MGITTKTWALDADAIEAQLDDLDEEIAAATVGRREAPGVYLTAATSGSNGIATTDDSNLDMATNGFAVAMGVALPDWTPSSDAIVAQKSDGTNGWVLSVLTTGKLRLTINTTNYDSTVPAVLVDGTAHLLCAIVSREAVGAAGSVVFTVDGVQLGGSVAITAGSPTTVSNASSLYLLGTSAVRTNGALYWFSLFNRTLTVAQALSIYRNGIDFSDQWAAQTALTSGTLTAGKRYRIDTFAAGDDFTNVGAASNASGVEFVATGTTPTTWTNGSSLRAIGAVVCYDNADFQPSPGQCLDSSTNKLHALQPAAGATLTTPKTTFELRQVLSWANTEEAKYIGGNQSVLPVGCYIESIIGVISGANVQDIIIGDGSDDNKWVEVTDGLAASTTSFTLASRISDGTNYKLVVDPDTNCTMSVSFVVRGVIL